MSLPGIKVSSQTELVEQKMNAENFAKKEEVEILKLPGIAVLHHRSFGEIGEVIANVLKSRKNIASIKYVIGSHFEITLQ